MTWSPHPWDSVGIWMGGRLLCCRVSQHTRKPLCVLQGKGKHLFGNVLAVWCSFVQSKWTSYFTTIVCIHMYSPNLVASFGLLLLWILLDSFRCLLSSSAFVAINVWWLQRALHESPLPLQMMPNQQKTRSDIPKWEEGYRLDIPQTTWVFADKWYVEWFLPSYQPGLPFTTKSIQFILKSFPCGSYAGTSFGWSSSWAEPRGLKEPVEYTPSKE